MQVAHLESGAVLTKKATLTPFFLCVLLYYCLFTTCIQVAHLESEVVLTKKATLTLRGELDVAKSQLNKAKGKVRLVYAALSY
jgi:hypothetical protein